MNKEFEKTFLTNTDETGRFVVSSVRTGRKYFVEAIGDPHRKWGSIIPGDPSHLATKKGAGKYRGSIDAENSLISEETGFVKVHDLEPGMSPMAYIDHLDEQYPDKPQA
jgi:hypothetical protein